MKKHWILLALFVSVIFTTIQIFGNDNVQNTYIEDDESIVASSHVLKEPKNTLTVTLINTEGEKIGEAQLSKQKKGVSIELKASKLPPGVHGFHIHENGVCDVPTFETAGAHFNPTNAKHGFDNPEGPHAGDLPNIEVTEDGTIAVAILAEMVTLKKNKANSLLKNGGTSLIIHSGPDDYKTDPSGNSGERIACGVISK